MPYWNVAIATISSLHVNRLTFVSVGVTAVLNLVFLTNSLQSTEYYTQTNAQIVYYTLVQNLLH